MRDVEKILDAMLTAYSFAIATDDSYFALNRAMCTPALRAQDKALEIERKIAYSKDGHYPRETNGNRILPVRSRVCLAELLHKAGLPINLSVQSSPHPILE